MPSLYLYFKFSVLCTVMCYMYWLFNLFVIHVHVDNILNIHVRL